MPELATEPCALCERVTKQGNSAHHLLPRTCHKNKWFKRNFTREQMHTTVPLCRDCHRAVHRLIPCEKELGKHYHTLDELKAHPAIAKFLGWVRKQR